ncbi:MULTISPECIES: DUF58 domain-containing protein [Halorussus]|uniref:DUF58 domain-containing protein n=1 Tax=Halorussus TaxID=1070314 RepID=UPI00209FA8E5|nr:DUF58 domain-containing protein [Halorussus vallis]USZ74609.1 DUF58 domain-containing protein [Halorussus vallis]
MLTRRGWALVAVVVAAVAMAARFSPRALNAVVGPAVVALVAAAVQMRRAAQPDLKLRVPEYGFAGETATVSLDFDAPTPLSAVVALDAADGLDASDDRVETTVDSGTVTFDVDLRERGVGRVGPVEVVAQDVFGLWKRTYRYPVEREVVVFPRIRRLRDAGDLAALHREFGLNGRERFDQLREYERGDPLRDVHWKSSAKRPDADLVVMEFEADEERQRIELLAEADEGRADDVAEAAASVATYLLEADLAVGLTVPGGRVEPGAGDEHLTELLSALARTSAGTVAGDRREDADVVVAGPKDSEEVRVTVGERTVTFGQLSGDADATPGATAGDSAESPVAAGSGAWESVATDGGGDRR